MPSELEQLRQECFDLKKQLHESEMLRGESGDRFKRLFNASPNPMLIISLKDRRLICSNDAYIRLGAFGLENQIGAIDRDDNSNIYPLQGESSLQGLRNAHGFQGKKIEIQDGAGKKRMGLLSAIPVSMNGESCLLIVFVDTTDREKDADDLRRSRERYKTLVETSLQGVAIIQDDRIVYCTPLFAGMLGYTIEEVRAFSANQIAALVHPDDRDLIQQRRQDRESGKHVSPSCEYRTIRKDGSAFWVQIFTNVIEYNGRPAIQSAFIDITERKHAEAALRESEQRFRLIAETIDAFLWIYDFSQKVTTYLSPVFDRIYGFSREKILNNSEIWLDAIHPDDRPKFLEGFAHMRAGMPLNHEYRIIRPDGAVRNLWDCGTPIYDKNGNITQCVGFGRDVTEWRQAEEALKDSREYLLQILDCMGDPIYVRDREHKTVLANKTFCKVAGMSQTEVVGKTVYDFLPKQKADRCWQYEENVLSTGMDFDVEEEAPDKNGNPGHFLTSRRAFIDSKGNVQLITAVHDITEFKRLHAQFLQSQKMEALGVLAGGVAHDFNNLLNVINGYSELIMEDLPKESPIRTDMEQVVNAGHRAAALTAQLLAFGRRQIIQPEILNLNEIMEEMSLMLHRLIAENIRVNFIPQPDLGFIQADPGQIHQIIMNLAINARDAMPQGGQLVFETHNVTVDEAYIHTHPVAVAGPYVMLAVSDSGMGMDEATQSRIFDPFFTTKAKGKGTGLGLSTIYGIVKQNKGYIWVYSELGKGTTFKIYLPRIEGQAAPKAAKPGVKHMLRGSETILVVEDEPSVRILAARILRDHGYQVLEAEDGLDALRLSGEYKDKIHLVLTDAVMPGMGGKELTEKIRETRPDIRSLFTSGYTDSVIVQNNILDKDISFLPKPYDVLALVNKVREVLEQGKD